ncbi:suppressor protein of bem1/bed5 double mutants [Paracoccidioides lutzii Pb01]|uniref:Suppressor protein of bem1/bed5 double mutants n=1 Tax=Paracoccidioides lutzii (strain ATCC MYA-826 / Pb01) TaxID=502779 RepID=C1H243_PARBA|nr:suppressor protein of bem1/bed5 double mutants [Paracoccidioides lutzii Pb01]EEH33623.1 suppressor protein of bem1/bed5 double mutants [Paracoccidioides lutzii Pb01]
MPRASKRTLEEIALKSDSNDGDYSDSKPRTARKATASKSKSKKRPIKRRRRNSMEDDDEDEDDIFTSDDDISVDSGLDEDDPNLERTARGSIKRSAAKKANYQISSSGEDDEMFGEEEEEEEEDDEQQVRGETRNADKGRATKRLVLKLPITTQPTSARSTRNRRGRSASKDHTIPTEYQFTRRTTRRNYNESEDIVALTGSGRHVETVRKATRSPEVATRTRRGAATPAHVPSKSTIDEEGDSMQPGQHEGDAMIAEPGASQIEILESDQHGEFEGDHLTGEHVEEMDAEMDGDAGGFVPESDQGEGNEEEKEKHDDDDEESPRSGKCTRSNRKRNTSVETVEVVGRFTRRSARKTASATKSSRQPQEDGSDFEPNDDEANDEDLSESEVSQPSPRKGSQNADEAYESSNDRRSRLRKRQSQSQTRVESEAGELAEELAELRPERRRRRAQNDIVFEDKPRRNRKLVDYRIVRPEIVLPIDEEDMASGSPSRRGRAGGSGYQRTLFSTYGPFGGAGGPAPLLGGPTGAGAAGGVDSDSSDDDSGQRPMVGGMAGMTPTSGHAPGFNIPPLGQAFGTDTAPGLSGTPANFGKVKDKQALADSDPLGIDPNVNFDSVGGLQGHIDQLKEMVALPLLYPEIFHRFHIVPPRGVLFHGPPGTGKTLLARALASSVSTEGRKVTFYMRKGADALSKWVGEAERQLRLLFDEARKTQPSIIFFDEIDGLAPVRSSKQEQIHSSIVSTLLALMDGMDGRGQVIVIGATNRPDSIDPALRRPGRFDREFYFPLPNTEARRAILDIHTRGWDPPLPDEIKNELAELTKGYGGADLRALCTEAALNAVQRRYPQIYRSNEKLLIDPKKIEILPKDFMISIKKMVPSSERSASTGASPLPPIVAPLLENPLREIKRILAEILPQKKKLTALEEAQFEEPAGPAGFQRERMQLEFETSRIFRPRLLIWGHPGMGQQYIAAALLNHFEGLHVQAFDLPTLISDSTRSPEASLVQLFTEVKRYKPSVIYIPNVQSWYDTVGPTVISTFLGLLRSLPPTDPVLLLGVHENEGDNTDSAMMRNLFGFSKKNRFDLHPPESRWRHQFFGTLMKYIKSAPPDFPDPENRKKRKLEQLEKAPPAPPRRPPPLTREELKAQKKQDRHTLNILKIKIQPIMDQIKKYKKFRTGIIDENRIGYLYEEEDPNVVTSDIPLEQRTTFRPFEKGVDKHGVPGLRETVTGKFYYNMEIVTIEKRLSNGYYKRPKDFLADIKRIAKDARQSGDQDRQLKANELLSNVEVDIWILEQSDPALVTECEQVYLRELERERVALEKLKRAAGGDGIMAPPPLMNVPHGNMTEKSNLSSGPVILGEPFSGPHPAIQAEPTTLIRVTNQNTITNGHGPNTNGGAEVIETATRPVISYGSVCVDGDIHMSNSDEVQHSEHNNTENSSFGQSAQPRPPHSYTAPSQQLRQQSGLSNLSQKGPMTPMAPGSQPGDYANDASTTQTTSDKKNSGPSDVPNLQTQSSQGGLARQEYPDLNPYPDRLSGDEPIPDTQQAESGAWGTPLSGIVDFVNSQPSFINGSQSQGNNSKLSQPFSQPRVPPFDASGVKTTTTPRQSRVRELLNDDGTTQHQPAGKLIVDNHRFESLHQTFTQRTNGLSVEQLEQINTSLMDCVWRMRGEWNRLEVAEAVEQTFEEVLMDIQSMQDFGVIP